MDRPRTIVLALLLLLLLGGERRSVYARQADTARFAAVVSHLVASVNAQEYDSLQSRYSADLQKSLPIAKTRLLFQRMRERSGLILRHSAPRVVSSRQANTTLGLERGVQELQLYLDAQGRINGYVLLTKSEVPPARSFLDSLAPDPSPLPATPETAATPLVAVTAEQPAPAGDPAPKQDAPPTAAPTPNPEVAQPLPVSLPPPTTDNAGSPAATPPPAASEKPRTPPVDPVSPAPVSEPTPVIRDKQMTPLFPPFRGDWLVTAGGQDIGEATQRNLLAQQYSYEFSAHKNDERFRGNGTKCEDYYSFGQEILAPAGGVVVEAIDGIPDNDPGARNPYALIGNAVVIRHSDREYSVLAFLKRGSVKVRVGDAVLRGQVIGLCGSSGAATEPSLHFHLQNSSQWSSASTVKFYFEQVGFLNGEGLSVRRDHSPVAGDRLRLE